MQNNYFEQLISTRERIATETQKCFCKAFINAVDFRMIDMRTYGKTKTSLILNDDIGDLVAYGKWRKSPFVCRDLVTGHIKDRYGADLVVIKSPYTGSTTASCEIEVFPQLKSVYLTVKGDVSD